VKLPEEIMAADGGVGCTFLAIYMTNFVVTVAWGFLVKEYFLVSMGYYELLWVTVRVRE
jgi:hypothetical protein